MIVEFEQSSFEVKHMLMYSDIIGTCIILCPFKILTDVNT